MDIKKLKKSQKGGLKKSDYSLAQFIEMFKRIPESDILKNLPNYIDRQIDKLEKLKRTLTEKIDDDIKIDYSNRRTMVENINSTIPGDGKVKNAYLESLNADVREFMEKIRNNNFSVQQMEEYISKFRAAKDKIKAQYVKSYKEECIKMFEDDFENSDTLIAYKEELLEYLIIVLGKGDIPNQNPFCVVLTGSPGLGKSSLANQIVKLLKVTNLLPIGKFINIKKPDVIGQYLGQTAPKTYKILTSAIGSIAFIDEAYSFAGEEKPAFGFDHFGKEFIDALVDFIEEYKGLISIVAAGYKDEMDKQFFKVNTGLARRFPIQLNIKELKAITILKYLFDQKVLIDFLSIEPVRHFIQNFIRLAFNIEQTTKHRISFIYRFIVDSDGTKDTKVVASQENQSFMSHFFVKNGLFSNNWTDVQIFLDFLMNNIKLIQDPEVILKNTIKGYLTTKLENSNIENSNIEITISIRDFTDGLQMGIGLDTDDNEKRITSKNLKNDENEKTTEGELFEYFSRNKKKFDAEPPEAPKEHKSNRPKSSSSASAVTPSASAASAAKPSASAASAAKPSVTASSSSSAQAAAMSAISASEAADMSAISASEAAKTVSSTIKYIIDNHPTIVYGNCYLENFLRTMFNIQQYPQNQVIYVVNYTPEYWNERDGPFSHFRSVLTHPIKPKKMYRVFQDKIKNFQYHPIALSVLINKHAAAGILRKEEIIAEAISDYIKTIPEIDPTSTHVYIDNRNYAPDGYFQDKSDHLVIRITFKVNPPNKEALNYEDTEFIVDDSIDQADINSYKLKLMSKR